MYIPMAVMSTAKLYGYDYSMATPAAAMATVASYQEEKEGKNKE